MESSSSSSQATTMRRPCFVEDDGLASIAGFSGFNHNQTQPFVGQKIPPLMVRRNSLRNLNSLSSSPFPVSSSSSTTTATTTSSVFSPRSGRFFDARFEDVHSPPHFLEACFLCKKPLGGNRDIFMYRGDTPFCSEECREEQIEIDEASEKKRNLKAFRIKKESKNSASKSSSSSSSSPGKNYSIRTGAVAAA